MSAHATTAARRESTDGPVITVISAAARFGLAAVWLWSGIAKLTAPLDAVQAVAAYEILSESLVEPVAMGLPIVELVLGLMLLVGVFLRPAALISGLIMVGFIVGLASAWARGLAIDCGCFGGGGENPDATMWTYLRSMVRDVVFIVLAAIVWWRPFRKFAIHA